jgi:hypothetical protein
MDKAEELCAQLRGRTCSLALNLEAADLIEQQRQEIARLREALNIFAKCAYPVATEINPRGHNWSEAYLDQALPIAQAALEKKPC